MKNQYKVDRDKLKYYCDKFGWNILEKVPHIVLIDTEIIPHSYYQDYFDKNHIKLYSIKSPLGHYIPGDCLTPLRATKLKRILE